MSSRLLCVKEPARRQLMCRIWMSAFSPFSLLFVWKESIAWNKWAQILLSDCIHLGECHYSPWGYFGFTESYLNFFGSNWYFLDFYAAIHGKSFIKHSKFKLFINQSSHIPKPDVLNIQMTVATSNNIQYGCIIASFPHLSFTSATPIGGLKDLPQ